MHSSLVTASVAVAARPTIREPIIHRVFASHEAEFPPIPAVSSPWQEHLATELVTVVRDSIRGLTPRQRRRAVDRVSASAA